MELNPQGIPIDSALAYQVAFDHRYNKEVANYTQVMEKLPGARAEQIAIALGSRGWWHYQKNDFARFLADTNEALVKNDKLDTVAFNLGLALMANNRDIESLRVQSGRREISG